MKKKTEQLKVEDDAMLSEYDFTGKKGVRGKYYRAYRQGHTVKVHKADGTVSLRYFTLAEGAVMLEPDIREYFPNSESVNTALRSLIALKPTKSTRRKIATQARRAKLKEQPSARSQRLR